METVPDDHKSAVQCLAPPSAPHTEPLVLAGATPADREGVRKARMGRSCLFRMFAVAA